MDSGDITKENFKNEDNGRYEARAHVLVVDDDRRIRDLLTRYLGEQGFVVLAAADANEARTFLKRFEVDVLVVDVMMPGQTGLEFTQEFRDQFQTPVILLTALGETEDRIKGLEAGADDYLAKPFEPRELVLRINAILKRSFTKMDVEKGFKVGGWEFNPSSNELVNGMEIVKLTSAESVLLKALASSNGEVLSREVLAEKCGVDAGERTIDVQVTRLRRKIEEDTKNPRYLQTLRGKGYLLRVEAI